MRDERVGESGAGGAGATRQDPSGAERILTLAELEQEFRHAGDPDGTLG